MLCYTYIAYLFAHPIVFSLSLPLLYDETVLFIYSIHVVSNCPFEFCERQLNSYAHLQWLLWIQKLRECAVKLKFTPEQTQRERMSIGILFL